MKIVFVILSLFMSHQMVWSQDNSSDVVQRYNIQLSQNCDKKLFEKNLQKKLELSQDQFVLESIYPDRNIYNLRMSAVNKNVNVTQALNSLKVILRFESDKPVEYRATPDDPHLSQQWGLEIIKARDAWNITTGGQTATQKEVVVAILDNGFDIFHEDLAENIWINKGEMANNGIDDDQNGYIDDVYGLNAKNGSDQHMARSHGTGVIGIIGAKGNNNVGVTGINWNVKLMLISDTGFSSEVIKGYAYILKQRQLYNSTNGKKGALVVATNFSGGIDNALAKDFPIWCDLYNDMGQAGIVSICATTNNNVDVDTEGDMPSTCTSNYLIATTNTNMLDAKASAGYGKTNIDLGAPGDESYTTALENSYTSFGGTSAASPHVAGAVALLFSSPCSQLDELMTSDPVSAARQVRDLILAGVDPLASLEDNTVSGGRLNIYNSMLLLAQQCEGSLGELEIKNIFPNPIKDGELTIEYETPELEPYYFRIISGDGRIIISDYMNPILFGKKYQIYDVSNLPAGIYFYQISNTKETVAKSFTVIK